MPVEAGVEAGVRLRVSAALSHGRLCVVRLLKEFAGLYRHILIDIALADMLVDVAGCQAEAAIRFGPLADSSLTTRKLGREPADSCRARRYGDGKHLLLSASPSSDSRKEGDHDRSDHARPRD